MRATPSLAPPGGNETMRRIGRSGNAACALPVKTKIAHSAAATSATRGMWRARVICWISGTDWRGGGKLIVFQFETICYFHFDAERGSSNGSGRRSCRMRMLRFAPHAFAIVAFAAVAMPALAQEWPSGTVRVVVPYAAGGPVDVPARLLIDRLAAQTKGVFILENRPGAGGSLGPPAGGPAAPPGGPLLLTTAAGAEGPPLSPQLAVDPPPAPP